jgi:hypothetical protein
MNGLLTQASDPPCRMMHVLTSQQTFDRLEKHSNLTPYHRYSLSTGQKKTLNWDIYVASCQPLD